MLIELMLTIPFAFFNFLFSVIFPETSFGMPSEVFIMLFDALTLTAWFLPWAACMPIIYFSLALDVVALTMALKRFIMRFIPTLGG